MKKKLFLGIMALAIISFSACDKNDISLVVDENVAIDLKGAKIIYGQESGDELVLYSWGGITSSQFAALPTPPFNNGSITYGGTIEITREKNGNGPVYLLFHEGGEYVDGIFTLGVRYKASNDVIFEFNVAACIEYGEKIWLDSEIMFEDLGPAVYNEMGKITQIRIQGWEAPKNPVQPVIVNLGFIGYYINDGKVMSTSIHWQYLEEGDCIDWDAVDAAYAEWVAQGGLEPDRTLWQTSGYASYTFEDYEEKCWVDFSIGQIEGFYYSYYVDPGYLLPGDNGNCDIWFEHTSGGQYGYVGMSYQGEGSPSVQLIPLKGNDYTYKITTRVAWPGLDNTYGVTLPVIGSMNPVFNILGTPGVVGQQEHPRAGYYEVEATSKATGEKVIINILITPTVQDQAKLGLSEGSYNCGYFGSSKVRAFSRYVAYVELWNDLFLAAGGHGTVIGDILAKSGGTDHYNTLCKHYDANALPPYFRFGFDDLDETGAFFDEWADALEPGLIQVYGAAELDAYVKAHVSNN